MFEIGDGRHKVLRAVGRLGRWVMGVLRDVYLVGGWDVMG
jgi:hypothetical protein